MKREPFSKRAGQNNFPKLQLSRVERCPNSPLSGTGVSCSSHRFCTRVAPCTANVSGRRVRTGTSRTGREEGWTCRFRVAFTAAPKLQHPYSARARSPKAARQQQSVAVLWSAEMRARGGGGGRGGGLASHWIAAGCTGTLLRVSQTSLTIPQSNRPLCKCLFLGRSFVVCVARCSCVRVTISSMKKY